MIQSPNNTFSLLYLSEYTRTIAYTVSHIIDRLIQYRMGWDEIGQLGVGDREWSV